MCKTVLLDCKEICVLSLQQNTLQTSQKGWEKQIAWLPHSDCCYPAFFSHRNASLICSSILLSFLSLRSCIFQGKWRLQNRGASSLQSNNQQKCDDCLKADSYGIVSAIDFLFSPHFSCLMPAVPIAFSVLHKTAKDFSLFLWFGDAVIQYATL